MYGPLRTIGLSKLAQVIVLAGCASPGLSAATIFTDFEGIPDGMPFVSQLGGYTFANAVVLSAQLSLNEVDFPPHSGVNVIGDIGGPISITGYAQSFSGFFTYSTPLTIDGFDAGGILRVTAMSQFPENFTSSGIGSPNELISISYPAGLQTITITGDPNGTSFALDDVTLTTPEPATGWFVIGDNPAGRQPPRQFQRCPLSIRNCSVFVRHNRRPTWRAFHRAHIGYYSRRPVR
jgi:hypothetical protein